MMENESEQEETVTLTHGTDIVQAYPVTLTHGTDIFHGYQVINTQTPFANTIYIFGAPSPPIIILSQVQRNDEGHHSHSWIKRLAEKLFGRRLALREPHHEKNNYFNNENTNRNQAHIYIMNNYIKFSNCVIINNGINQHENENHEQKEDSKSERASDKDDHEATVECVKTETATPQEPLSNVPPRTVKDFSHSPLVAYMTYPEHANYLLGHLHQEMEKQKTARGRILYLKAVCEVGLFKSRIPYTAYVIEFGKNMSQSNYSRLMGNGGKYTNDEITLALESIDLSVFKSKNKA